MLEKERTYDGGDGIIVNQRIHASLHEVQHFLRTCITMNDGINTYIHTYHMQSVKVLQGMQEEVLPAVAHHGCSLEMIKT